MAHDHRVSYFVYFKEFVRHYFSMRGLNSFIHKKKFRMQGLKDVRDILAQGMYGGVIDISDAYYHISIHKKARKYCRFILDGVVYEYLGKIFKLIIFGMNIWLFRIAHGSVL